MNETTTNTPETQDRVDEGREKYLLFMLGGEYYGVPLLTVKEVIRLRGVKQVPYMHRHFIGVINLRGQIVGVSDLRLRYGKPQCDPEESRVLIVKVERDGVSGLLGAVVDDLYSVTELGKAEIDRPTNLEVSVASQYFIGVAKLPDRLVTLIDLAGSLSDEEFRQAA